jgi:diacylglycerol kinase family enzyme
MKRIDVIATTISGSISDWSKVKRIVPLFQELGFDNVNLHETDSHQGAREIARKVLLEGGRYPISAGGSGTFRAVLEGCIDSGIKTSDIRLGFLRKGSADLIGKTLGMPDGIENAIRVLADAMNNDNYLPADILTACSQHDQDKKMNFIGYGGTGIFGRIPHFTENRFIKYYKGILGQLFGDLGPFTTGMILALIETAVKSTFQKPLKQQIIIDDNVVTEGVYRTILIVNGNLGPDLPFSDKPLGSQEFYVYCIRDQGLLKLFQQARHAKKGTIKDEPETWGFESYCVEKRLTIYSGADSEFPVNIDGSTLQAKSAVDIARTGTISLLANSEFQLSSANLS